MAAPFILAIDQGTSSTKCLLVDRTGAVVARGSAPLGEQHPQPGWVEQDAEEIFRSVQAAVATCLAGCDGREVAAVGFSTQRESCIVWDRTTGMPLSPLLSWQDQRTAELCDGLREAGHEAFIRARSGLPLDPMFSAIKARWLLDRIDPDRQRAAAGEICVGTVDAFLLSRFSAEPITEVGNASRTQLMDVRRAAWDADLCGLFGIPMTVLPRIVPSVGPFPEARGLAPLPDGTPILAVMGDSHSALFAHGAFEAGQAKATYGTGSSVMGLVDRADALDAGLCLTIAWQIERSQLAAEGNIRASGSTLRWVAEMLGIGTAELADMAHGADAQGVALVPGFNGLGAPWWDRDAVGLLTGFTLGTPRSAIARAALESIPQQITDVLEALDRSIGRVGALFADGGATMNPDIMQLQADFAGRPVLRSATPELSALGVAHLAGLGAGFWSWDELRALPRERDRFEPALPSAERGRCRSAWRAAVARALEGGMAARPALHRVAPALEVVS